MDDGGAQKRMGEGARAYPAHNSRAMAHHSDG